MTTTETAIRNLEIALENARDFADAESARFNALWEDHRICLLNEPEKDAEIRRLRELVKQLKIK